VSAAVELTESFPITGVTPQQCFDYIDDVENVGEWLSVAKSATVEGERGLGRVINAKIQFIIPLPFTIKVTVTSYEEPVRYAVTSKVPFTCELGGSFEEIPGGTRLTYFITMEPTKFFPVPRMVLKKALTSQFRKDGRLLQAALQRLA
jgi:carbon monoxide dehydrogenase subunit G